MAKSKIYGLTSSTGSTGAYTSTINTNGLLSNSTTTIAYGSGLSTTPFIGYSHVIQETTYHFMGEEIKVQGGYKNREVAMCLASIEANGWKYYESLVRNEVSFEGNLGEHLDRLYLQHCRDQKIESILHDK
jgi:hypothetical protein